MIDRLKHVPLALYGLALICFLMPFITVSCGPVSLEVSGWELAVGKDMERGGRTQEVEVYRGAAMAGTCALLGLLVGGIAFLRGRASWPAGDMALASAGVVGLIWLMVVVQMELTEARAESEAPISVSFNVGYWLALVSFIGAGVVAGYCRGEARATAENVAVGGAAPEPTRAGPEEPAGQ